MKTLNRSEIPPVRASLGLLQLTVAEADAGLRYVWVDNPHPDFDPASVIGKRDDELMPADDAKDLMQLKRDVLEGAEPIRRIIGFHRSDGWHVYAVSALPLRNDAGAVDGVLTVGFDTPGTLFGFIPICARCHRIRDERGDWQRLEKYLTDRTKAQLSHSICPHCTKKLFPDVPLD